MYVSLAGSNIKITVAIIVNLIYLEIIKRVQLGVPLDI